MVLFLNQFVIAANIANNTTTATDGSGESCFLQFEDYDPRAHLQWDIPLVYFVIFLTIIIICSICYWAWLMKKKIIYAKNCSLKFISYFKSVKDFRVMYLSIFTQLFDQVSDISVVYQLYWLSRDETDKYSDDLCPCMFALAICCLFS